MGKESHRMRASIKPQVVQAADGFTARKMNVDIELDQSSQFEAYDFLMSPPKPPAVDTVDWANSQPVALRTLLLEVTKRPEKRAMKAETTWPSYVDDSFDPVASTSSDATSAKHRPLRRTNSSLRARLGPDSASHSSDPPPAPDDSFWGKDRHAILAVCQNVSERMDENAFLRADKAGEGLTKRKVRQPHLTGVSKVKRAFMPHHVAQRQETNRWDKGKQRESLVSEFKPQSTERRVLLASSSSSSSSSSTNLSSPVISSSSLHSTDASLTIDLETSDVSMMDIEPDHEPVSASSSIYAVEKKPSPITTRPIPTGHSAPTSTPRLHPLLTQHHRPNPPKAQAPPIPHKQLARPLPEHPPFLHNNLPSLALSLSQSARPPALGMRRVHTAPIPSQHALPIRQKGFKPPLRSQPVPQAKPQAPAPQHPAKFSFPRPSEGQVTTSPSPSDLHPSPAHPYPNFSGRSNGRAPKDQVQEHPKAKPTRLDAPPDPSPPPPYPLHTYNNNNNNNARMASNSWDRDRDRDEQAQAQARPPSPEEVNPDADSSFGDMSFDMDALEATMQMYD
ncbi:hypothetical protein D9615_005572 [Tricholomella constricta]|uniref:Uncharacterized protein n=1 Tax=Tricholomella constricta TaxID=117010 RepID=A0A8H5HEA4_9AGAR|nr:hypothetical protein D9615_005572 [Tricholomella constricta]